MIFLARQLQEKWREQRKDFCIAFIDLSKAFDTVTGICSDKFWDVQGKLLNSLTMWGLSITKLRVQSLSQMKNLYPLLWELEWYKAVYWCQSNSTSSLQLLLTFSNSPSHGTWCWTNLQALRQRIWSDQTEGENKSLPRLHHLTPVCRRLCTCGSLTWGFPIVIDCS